MEKLEGGGCESGGDLQDMVRQAIEDVVREQIGGGAEDGGCAAESGATAAGGTADDSSNAIDSSDPSNSLLNRCSQDEEKEKSKAEGSSSWLVALAKAMGEMTGDHLTKMMQAQENMENSQVDEGSDEYKNATDEEKADMKQEAGREFTKYQAEFQAESKLFSMCSEATSTVLKSIGEGLSSMARKQ
jgi:hypothetical protein